MIAVASPDQEDQQDARHQPRDEDLGLDPDRVNEDGRDEWGMGDMGEAAHRRGGGYLCVFFFGFRVVGASECRFWV